VSSAHSESDSFRFTCERSIRQNSMRLVSISHLSDRRLLLRNFSPWICSWPSKTNRRHYVVFSERLKFICMPRRTSQAIEHSCGVKLGLDRFGGGLLLDCLRYRKSLTKQPIRVSSKTSSINTTRKTNYTSLAPLRK
jgi:hypothetical protein